MRNFYEKKSLNFRGEADVPLFEAKSKTCMISDHKRVITLKLGTAVAYFSPQKQLLCRILEL